MFNTPPPLLPTVGHCFTARHAVVEGLLVFESVAKSVLRQNYATVCTQIIIIKKQNIFSHFVLQFYANLFLRMHYFFTFTWHRDLVAISFFTTNSHFCKWHLKCQPHYIPVPVRFRGDSVTGLALHFLALLVL